MGICEIFGGGSKPLVHPKLKRMPIEEVGVRIPSVPLKEFIMKCGALVYRELRGKKYPKVKVVQLVTPKLLATGFKLKYPREQYEVCDGKLKVSINIEDDSHCSCCSNPYIVSKFACDKCAYVEYLYDKESLEKFFNEALDGSENGPKGIR